MRALVLFIITFSVIFVFASSVGATARSGYEAMQVVASGSGTLKMAPGEEKKYTIGFQNIGTKTWTNSGSEFISIYTHGPKYRSSDFEDAGWYDGVQPVKLRESSVAPGEVGYIVFTLEAPLKEGSYEETFYLASEDTAWIPGGEFSINIKVQGSSDNEVETTDGIASSVSDSGLSAMLLLRSDKNLQAKGGEEINFKVGIKNTGTVSWLTRSLVTSDTAIASVSSDTYHASWASATRLVQNTEGVVKPGGLDFLSFTFTAPTTKGDHTIRYYLAANDSVVPDFYFEIPIEVTSNSGSAVESPVVVEEDELFNEIDEPIMRIGILIVDEETDDQVEISCNTDWNLYDGDGGLLGKLEANEMVRAFYKNQRYYFNRGQGLEETYKYLRFVPNDDDAICTIENFDRRATRNAAYADNTFRDILELRYNSDNDRTWIINELPVEEYLRGLAETSNYSHEDFKKSLMVIARTYSLYHWERATKHADEYFHMNAYADDQVYKGYEYETRHPLIGEAAEDTVGITVAYEGRTAITPYFSRSDGRTRDWSEVWGGDVPWCKGVVAPGDEGKTMWGHGIGLSASSALYMANNGSTWEEVLHHFYTDIDLIQRWK